MSVRREAANRVTINQHVGIRAGAVQLMLDSSTCAHAGRRGERVGGDPAHEGSLQFNRDFNRVPTIQQGFQQGPQNSTGISTGSLQFNRDLNRVLRIQQGFEQGGAASGWGATPQHTKSDPAHPSSRVRLWEVTPSPPSRPPSVNHLDVRPAAAAVRVAVATAAAAVGVAVMGGDDGGAAPPVEF